LPPSGLVVNRLEPFVETLVRLTQPSLHAGWCIEVAGREGGKDRRAGNESAVTVAQERDRLDRLIFGRAGMDEGPDLRVSRIAAWLVSGVPGFSILTFLTLNEAS